MFWCSLLSWKAWDGIALNTYRGTDAAPWRFSSLQMLGCLRNSIPISVTWENDAISSVMGLTATISFGEICYRCPLAYPVHLLRHLTCRWMPIWNAMLPISHTASHFTSFSNELRGILTPSQVTERDNPLVSTWKDAGWCEHWQLLRQALSFRLGSIVQIFIFLAEVDAVPSEVIPYGSCSGQQLLSAGKDRFRFSRSSRRSNKMNVKTIFHEEQWLPPTDMMIYSQKVVTHFWFSLNFRRTDWADQVSSWFFAINANLPRCSFIHR
jgi:hypothetical protein